jgi:hypothetical protein
MAGENGIPLGIRFANELRRQSEAGGGNGSLRLGRLLVEDMLVAPAKAGASAFYGVSHAVRDAVGLEHSGAAGRFVAGAKEARDAVVGTWGVLKDKSAADKFRDMGKFGKDVGAKVVDTAKKDPVRLLATAIEVVAPIKGGALAKELRGDARAAKLGAAPPHISASPATCDAAPPSAPVVAKKIATADVWDLGPKKAIEKPKPLTAVLPSAPAEKVHPKNILAWKTGGPKGSNEGGFYTSADGVNRYVKFYDDPAQAHGELLANAMYRELGIEAPEAIVFEHEGKHVYASKLLEGKTLDEVGVTQENAREFFNGFAATFSSPTGMLLA